MAANKTEGQNDVLAAWKNRKKKKSATHEIPVLEEGQPARLSYGQQRLWLLDQLYPNQHLYHYAHQYSILGALDVDRLIQSFNLIAERHKVLLSSYKIQKDGSQLQIPQNGPIPAYFRDLSDLPEENIETSLARQVDQYAKAPFDLAGEILVRLHIFRCNNDRHEVLLVMHHIIGDAWSLGIINQEWASLYQNLNAEQTPELETLKFQYRDYANWQRNQQLNQADLNYWKEKLADNLPTLDLPKKPGANGSKQGATVSTRLTITQKEELAQLAKAQGTTMYVLMLALYKVLLSKYTQQTTLMVGSPFTNRDTSDLEKLVGFFNETIVLKTEVEGNLSFIDYLSNVKEATQEAFSHKNVPYDELVSLVKAQRNQDNNPLFQTMFLYSSPGVQLQLGKGLQVSEKMLNLGVAKFDLTLFVSERSEGLELALEYSLDFEHDFVSQMLEHLVTLTKNILKDPEKALKVIPMLSAANSEKILKMGQGPRTSLHTWKTATELIAEKTAKALNKPAVIMGEKWLTYAELDQWSDELAHKLQAQGIGKKSFVGLYTERSFEMITGIVAILKAGGAYLPLDPDYPVERLDFMLNDTGASVVLCQPEVDCGLDKKGRVFLEISRDNSKVATPEITNESNDYAYVIYTSGSTGQPKGVAVSHANLLHSTVARFSFFKAPMERFLLLSSFSFDSSVAGIFWALCSGGALVLPPKRIEQDVMALSDLIESTQVTHSLMLPSLYQVLLQYTLIQKLSSLKAIIVAGEACSLALKDLHFDRLPFVRLYNEYGPTEATVWCIGHEIKPDDSKVFIGKAISNTEAYILDAEMNLLPAGLAGELYIGGAGVTQGYLNQAALTKERFLPNPFGENLLYKTGDLASFTKEGLLDFLGRADAQVKIRGFRVELEEIRSQILKQPQISEAVVQLDEEVSGTKKLVAWVQSEEANIATELKSQLRDALPDYMVPTSVLVTDSLPKLPNGKVDLKQLPYIEEFASAQSVFQAPSNPIEAQLAEIWQEVLGLSRVNVKDNFFDIGGDSIQSIKIVASARTKGLNTRPTDIFKYPTIEALAKRVSLLDKVESETSKEQYPLVFPLSYQQQAFLLHKLQAKEDQGTLQLAFDITGPIDKLIMESAWEMVIDQHPILRTSFHWQDKEAPYQKIHRSADLTWAFLDYSQIKNKVEEVANFKKKDRQKALDLQKPGGGRFCLIKLANDQHQLLWTCHHLLIDGWSGAIIVEDALKAYDALRHEQSYDKQPIPHFGQYLTWKAQQNGELARIFWKRMLANTKPHLFSQNQHNSEPTFETLSTYMNNVNVQQLLNLCRKERLTLNTVTQGLWMLTLASFFNSKDISLGITVTGRSSSFPGIDRMTGLLMNVLPIRKKIKQDSTLKAWLHELQATLNDLRAFEHSDADEIQGMTNGGNQPYFDSLFVFGNFIGEALRVGNLTVDDFKGGFSATMPLTIRVNPARRFEINCRYNAQIVSHQVAGWLLETYEGIIEKVVNQTFFDGELRTLLVEKPEKLELPSASEYQKDSTTQNEFAGTQNKTQLGLLQIWEEILGAQLIGIHDNYFDLGGTSLGAIQVFARIEQQFGKKLSPTTIIQHPTVASLSKLIIDDEGGQSWQSIIPMKSTGSDSPLFCLHSGGAHVLFYQGLAKYMDHNRPVYAIQPTGIDGEAEMHKDIAEMATHYITQMREIQPEGPYHLIGTCFGNALGIEMAHQLKELGEELAVLYVVDSAPAFLIPPSPNGERKPVRRMVAMMANGNWKGILKKFKNRFIRLDKKLKANKRTVHETELDEIIDSLNDIYTRYTWKPIDSKVVLVRSSEFSQQKDKQFHIDRWNTLAPDDLEVYEVEGHHLTLFEEPEVQCLAQLLDKHLTELDK